MVQSSVCIKDKTTKQFEPRKVKMAKGQMSSKQLMKETVAGLDEMSPLSRRGGHTRGQPQSGPGQVLLLPAQQVWQRQDGVREMSGEDVRLVQVCGWLPCIKTQQKARNRGHFVPKPIVCKGDFGFGCLELGLYGMRELASVTPRTSS